MLNSYNDFFTNPSNTFENFDEDFNIFKTELEEEDEKKRDHFMNLDFMDLSPLKNNTFGLSLKRDIVTEKYKDIFLDFSKKNYEDENFDEIGNCSFELFEKNAFEAELKTTHKKCCDHDKAKELDETFISKMEDKNLIKKLFQDSPVKDQENHFLKKGKKKKLDTSFLSTNENVFSDKTSAFLNQSMPTTNKKKTKKTKKKSSKNQIQFKGMKQKQLVECNCKKSKCLKLYCECFAKGLICGVDCNCKDCHNVEDLKDLREIVIKETLEKNPFAFKSKYKKIEKEDSFLHSRGCNCSKTGCVKKYCECYNAGTGCSRLCRCSNCLNDKIEIEDKEVKIYYDRVLRKRRKKSILNECFSNNSETFIKKFKPA